MVTALRGDTAGSDASSRRTPPGTPLIKEVETTCLYRLPPGLASPGSSGSGKEPLQFEALQRTATYLRPSNQVQARKQRERTRDATQLLLCDGSSSPLCKQEWRAG